MGLAPTPESLEEVPENGGKVTPNARKPNGTARPEVVTKTLKVSQSQEVVQLKGELVGVHWKYMKELLDMFEMLLTNDRQFIVARRKAMDYMTACKNELTATIVRIMVLDKQKENEGNAGGNGVPDQTKDGN